MFFNFQQQDNEPRHRCSTRREGDWAIFTCPQCPGYERRMNLRSGELKTRPGEDPFVLHEGVFVPTGLEQTYSLPN